VSDQSLAADGMLRSARQAPGKEIDLHLEAAQAALLARYAPDTRVRRLAWSQGETQVLELGAGPPLLLVHGAMSDACVWVPILQELARQHRVFAVDLPGHGLAEPFDYTAADMLEVAGAFMRDILDALGLRTANIAANSMGGLWSVVFAIDAPDRVSRLALVGAPLGESSLPTLPSAHPCHSTPAHRTAARPAHDVHPTRDADRKFWGRSASSIRSASTRRCSTRTWRARDETSKVTSACALLRKWRHGRCQASPDPGRALAVAEGADGLPLGRTRPVLRRTAEGEAIAARTRTSASSASPTRGTSCGSTTPTVWSGRSNGSSRRSPGDPARRRR
jgi:pimeloyl-ACP methyl ester carboxylesterase